MKKTIWVITLYTLLFIFITSTYSYGAQCAGNICASSTNLTILGKAVNLISPRNQTGETNGTITFIYNITSSNNITACSLQINGAVNQTNSSVIRGINSTFELTSLPIGPYNWSINCTDISNNSLTSIQRLVVIFNTDGFNTTNLSIVNITNLTSFFTETGSGKIEYNTTLNFYLGYNLSSFISITSNRIELNSSTEFNKSATLTLNGITSTNPRPLKDGAVCESNICTEISYSGGTFIFNVTHFTVYSSGETPTEAPSPGGGGGGPSEFIVIKVPRDGRIYDVIVTVLKNKYELDSTITANISLFNYGLPTERDVTLFYYLFSPESKIYTSSSRVIKEVPNCKPDNTTGLCKYPSYSFLVELPLPPGAEIGEWRVVAEKEQFVGFDNFRVVQQIPIAISGWIVALAIMFFLILFRKRIKVKLPRQARSRKRTIHIPLPRINFQLPRLRFFRGKRR